MEVQQKVKLISEQFNANGGMSYTLLKRTSSVALYKVDGYGWEVHKIRQVKLIEASLWDSSIIAQGYTHKEKLASNEDFGRYAKYCSSLERAEMWYKQWSRATMSEAQIRISERKKIQKEATA